MPPKKKKTKSKKRKEPTQKQTVKQSVVVKIGDQTIKKKRTYTKRKAPQQQITQPIRRDLVLAPSGVQTITPPQMNRLDPEIERLKASIQQFDGLSKSVNDMLQKVSRENLIRAHQQVAENEGEKGTLPEVEQIIVEQRPEEPLFMSAFQEGEEPTLLRTQEEEQILETPPSSGRKGRSDKGGTRGPNSKERSDKGGSRGPSLKTASAEALKRGYALVAVKTEEEPKKEEMDLVSPKGKSKSKK